MGYSDPFHCQRQPGVFDSAPIEHGHITPKMQFPILCARQVSKLLQGAWRLYAVQTTWTPLNHTDNI